VIPPPENFFWRRDLLTRGPLFFPRGAQKFLSGPIFPPCGMSRRRTYRGRCVHPDDLGPEHL